MIKKLFANVPAVNKTVHTPLARTPVQSFDVKATCLMEHGVAAFWNDCCWKAEAPLTVSSGRGAKSVAGMETVARRYVQFKQQGGSVQLVFCATLCAVSSSENRVAIDALKCVENNVCVKGIGSCIVHETEATRTASSSIFFGNGDVRMMFGGRHTWIRRRALAGSHHDPAQVREEAT